MLTKMYDSADEATDAVNNITELQSYGEYVMNSQAPVALIFDDMGVTSPSYALHFRYDSLYYG